MNCILYEAAEKFKHAALWTVLTQTDVFAVADGESILYCHVQKAENSVTTVKLPKEYAQFGNGLAVYEGESGLLSYYKTLRLRREKAHTGCMLVEADFSQSCLKCTFEDREWLDDTDYMDVKRCGLTYRGKAAWPKFRRHQLFCYSEHIAETDIHKLITALKAAVFFSIEVKQFGYSSLCTTQWTVPLVKVEVDNYSMSSLTLPDVEEHFTAPVLTNTEDIKNLSCRMTSGETLYCGILCPPIAMTDSLYRTPHVPYLFMMMSTDRARSGVTRLAAHGFAGDYESGVGEWMSQFCACIAEHGKPKKVIALDEKAGHLLNELCKQLRIPFHLLDFGRGCETDDRRMRLCREMDELAMEIVAKT